MAFDLLYDILGAIVNTLIYGLEAYRILGWLYEST